MSILEAYHFYNDEMSDPRSRDWLFMSSPGTITVLTFAYLYFVLRCGPRFMKGRDPYSLKTFIKLYNVFQILMNLKVISDIIKTGWVVETWIYCLPINYLYDQPSMTMCTVAWLFMVLKAVDYVETVIFVLRKKQKQVSFLHLYHHTSTLYITWLTAKYYAGDLAMFFILVNATVHVIMYSYYFLAAFGPMMQWLTGPFKRYITLVQMVQFIVLMIYTLRNYLPPCKYALFFGNIVLADLFINFMLFYNFYKSSYAGREKRAR